MKRVGNRIQCLDKEESRPSSSFNRNPDPGSRDDEADDAIALPKLPGSPENEDRLGRVPELDPLRVHCPVLDPKELLNRDIDPDRELEAEEEELRFR